MRQLIIAMMAAVVILLTAYLEAEGPFITADDRWQSMNEFSGTEDSCREISAMIRHGDYMYVAGGFDVFKNIMVNHIVRRHLPTGEWSSLGGGVGGWVRSLAVDSTGNIYAGGNFLKAGGVEARYIAKWDGAQWSSLDIGMAGDPDLAMEVDSLVIDHGKGMLYAGGNFATAGGVAANCIARWDGSAWHALGAGMTAGTGASPEVFALALDDAGNLYAGGWFSEAGGVTVNNVALWDGTQWHALGGGTDNVVYALAIDEAGDLYAGGYFTAAGGVAMNGVAKWNGTQWAPLGDELHNDDGFAASVYFLTFDDEGTLYVGGVFDRAGSVLANNIAKWDGNQWTAFGNGVEGGNYIPYAKAIMLEGNGRLYAGGQFTMIDNTRVNSIA